MIEVLLLLSSDSCSPWIYLQMGRCEDNEWRSQGETMNEKTSKQYFQMVLEPCGCEYISLELCFFAVARCRTRWPNDLYAVHRFVFYFEPLDISHHHFSYNLLEVLCWLIKWSIFIVYYLKYPIVQPSWIVRKLPQLLQLFSLWSGRVAQTSRL